MSGDYIHCPECGLIRLLSEHKHAMDTKTTARKWIQKNCPKGRTRGCSTKLVSTEPQRNRTFHFGKKLAKRS